jgi:hypothetical protein
MHDQFDERSLRPIDNHQHDEQSDRIDPMQAAGDRMRFEGLAVSDGVRQQDSPTGRYEAMHQVNQSSIEVMLNNRTPMTEPRLRNVMAVLELDHQALKALGPESGVTGFTKQHYGHIADALTRLQDNADPRTQNGIKQVVQGLRQISGAA